MTGREVLKRTSTPPLGHPFVKPHLLGGLSLSTSLLTGSCTELDEHLNNRATAWATCWRVSLVNVTPGSNGNPQASAFHTCWKNLILTCLDNCSRVPLKAACLDSLPFNMHICNLGRIGWSSCWCPRMYWCWGRRSLQSELGAQSLRGFHQQLHLYIWPRWGRNPGLPLLDLAPASDSLCNHCMCVCVLNHFSRVWLCVTLGTVAHQAPLSIGFSRQEYWCGLPFPSPGDLPDPGIELGYLMSPVWKGRFFATSATWEAPVTAQRRGKTLNMHSNIH